MPDEPEAERIRVLFVDDEQRVLDALVRMLRPQRAMWEVHTATDGASALAKLADMPFDLVVSDMRMPSMSGGQLLKLVAERHPRTIRFMLSGQADRGSLIQAIETTHRFLSKPCNAEHLRTAISRAYALRRLLADPDLAELAGRIGALPTAPDLYIDLCNELASPAPTMQRIAAIIEQDIGLTAKVLQLANAASFGGSQQVVGAQEAAGRLGLDIIRALVLADHLLGQCTSVDWNAGRWWEHSLRIALAARTIARCEHASDALLAAAFSAGMLHDCGSLLLAGHEDAAALSERHAALGAYLLGLWGLPDPVVEAVAWHHRPAATAAAGITPLLCVHAAGALIASDELDDTTQADAAWLAASGCSDLNRWRVAIAGGG